MVHKFLEFWAECKVLLVSPCKSFPLMRDNPAGFGGEIAGTTVWRLCMSVNTNLQVTKLFQLLSTPNDIWIRFVSL